MSHKIGMHWIKVHGRPDDLEYLRTLQPHSVKLVAGDVPDVQWISDVYKVAPNTLIVLRSWAMSEQKDDMKRDPAGTGQRHAGEWRGHVDRLRAEAGKRGLPFPPDANLLVLGINEPPVWEALQQTVAYTVAFLDDCKARGLKAGALNLSVGWPANSGPGTMPEWAPYEPILGAIQRGGHYLILHEYWADQGPTEMWGWWAGRYEKCSWQVPIIIGEAGIDMYVKNPSIDPQKRGWQGPASREKYLQDLQAYHQRVMGDPRIKSVQLYTSDYSSPWQSFDLLPLQSAIALWATALQPEPSYMRPVYITAPDGLNVRVEPHQAGRIITAYPYGQQITITGKGTGKWLPVLHLGQPGYVHADYVSDNPPPPLVKPNGTLVDRLAKQYGIDARKINAVIQVESGGRGFVDGRMIIRFEPHIFAGKAFGGDTFFKTGEPAWNGDQHFMRTSPAAAWQKFHGNQNGEWQALALATMISAEAAWQSCSMGAPQIMGFNHKILGYPSAAAMAFDFVKGEDTQIEAMFKWMKATGALDALSTGNYLKFAEIYNGTGQANHYADLIKGLLK